VRRRRDHGTGREPLFSLLAHMAPMNPKPGSMRSSDQAQRMQLLSKAHGSDNVCSVVNLNRIQRRSLSERHRAEVERGSDDVLHLRICGADAQHDVLRGRWLERLPGIARLSRINRLSQIGDLALLAVQYPVHVIVDGFALVCGHTNHPTHFQTLAQGLGALVCRLFRGHAWIRTFYRGRIYLECCHCGAQTNGWEVLT